MNTLAWPELLALFGHFISLSLLSIGGAISTAPDMHRYLVTQQGWLSDAQFSSAIAIAQAAPGPNILFVAVMGFQAAGLAGVAATLLGIMLPSTTLALAAARWGHARQHWPAVVAFKVGMAPVTVAPRLAAGCCSRGCGAAGMAHAAAFAVDDCCWRDCRGDRVDLMNHFLRLM
jgi:chromate transporter